MDKTRDVRRFSRQNKQQQLFSGEEDFVSLEKPKKERLIKKLSVVNKSNSSYEDCEMGSDRENESHSFMSNGGATPSKRFKLPKKFFDECNGGVDHAPVPRKLRSAMKKRGRESISPPLPDSKKLNHTIGGVESHKKDGLKQSKLSMKQGSSDWSRRQVVGPMSKDEEEVVESLFALAGIVPDNDGINTSKLESATSDAYPEASPECGKSSVPAFEDSAVTKEDLNSTCPFRTPDADPSSTVETSPKETAKVNSLKEPSVEEHLDSHDSKNSSLKSDICDPQVNLHGLMPSVLNRECNGDKPSWEPLKLPVLPELSLDSGLKHSIQKETSLIERNPKPALGTTAIGSQLGQQDVVIESRKNGLALWPGLSPMVLQGAGSHGPSQSSASKIPAWMDAAMCASRPPSYENGSSTGKVSKGTIGRKSLKRCTAHVYISHFIRDLQILESKEKLPLQPNQLRLPHEGQKQGIISSSNIVEINDFDMGRKGLNEVVSGSNIGSSTSERIPNEARSGILLRLNQDQQQTGTSSRIQTLQKQSFNFLSLSAGGGGAEATDNFNRTGNNGLEPSSHFQVPYLHSLTQHRTFMPLSMPPTRYASSAYPDQLSASTSASTQQVQLQSPQYVSSSGPFVGHSHASAAATLSKQQQQQFWAAQLAAQYRTSAGTAMNQFPSWLNGRQDPTMIPCSQSYISPSPSALEVVGPKYSPISQQQQQQQHFTSALPPGRVKRQDHHLPSVYEEIDGGFRSGGALPLQLLCNEHL